MQLWWFFFKYFKYEFQALFKLVPIHNFISLFKVHNKEWSTQRHDRLVMGFTLTTKVTKSSRFCLHRWFSKLKRFLKTTIIWHYQMLYILLNPDFFFFFVKQNNNVVSFSNVTYVCTELHARIYEIFAYPVAASNISHRNFLQLVFNFTF